MDQDKLKKVDAYCTLGEFEEARKLLDEIIDEDKSASDAWRLAAQIDWQYLNQIDKAYDELIEALRLDPKNMWALILMGNLICNGKHDPDTAEKYYKKVLKYYPKNVVALQNIGGVYLKDNRFDEAAEIYKKALALDETHANSYYGLALAYLNIHRFDDAFEYSRLGCIKGIDRPENPGVKENLQKLLFYVADILVKDANYDDVIKKLKAKEEYLGERPVKFEDDDDLVVYGKLEYAPIYLRDEHVIKRNPDTEYLPHIIAHELTHLDMMIANTKAGKGKVVIGTENNYKAFRKRYWHFFKKQFSDPKGFDAKMVFEHFFDGINMQILNCPLDMFVEDRLFEIKEMRPIQLLSLYRLQKEYITRANNKKIRSQLPLDLLRANMVMNMCSAMHLKKLYGVDVVDQYNATRNEFAQAKDMFDEYCAYVDTFKTGDEYELVDYFAESLNMTDYISIEDEDQYIESKKIAQQTKEEAEQVIYDKVKKTAEDIDVANAKFALKHQDGADASETMMMAMYMQGAMDFFDGKSNSEVRKVAMDIANIGMTGISPNKKYNVPSISDEDMSGYQLLAYYYVSWAIAMPEYLDQIGLPFTKAYEMAKAMRNKG